MARGKNQTTPTETTTPPAPPALVFTPGGEPPQGMTDEEINALVTEDEFDIFTDIGEALTRAGDRITYTIKRDGEFLAGSIKHPYSWDQIQQKYGAGTYQVSARSVKRGRYVKSESRNVAPPPETPDEFKEENMAPRAGTTDLMLLLQNMRRDEREEAREREERLEQQRREERERQEQRERERREEEKKSSNSVSEMMMMMMKSQSEQTTAMLTALMGGKKEELRLDKIVEMMDARMEKMLDRLTGGKAKGEMTVAEQMKMVMDAEDRAEKRTMRQIELAERKAEEIADRLGAGGGGEKESTVKQILDAAMPMVQSLAASKLGAMAATPSVPGVNPHQKALPPPPGPLTAPRGVVRAPNLGQTLGLNKTPGQKVAPKPEVPNMKAKIEAVVVEEIGKDLQANMLSQNFQPEQAADKALAVLAKDKITPAMVCSQYSLDDMLSAAKARGLPDVIKPYLERFYAHVRGKTGADSRSEATMGNGAPAQSNQPTNS